MSGQSTTLSPANTGARPCASVPLARILERIVRSADHAALCELHGHRTPCRLHRQATVSVERYIFAAFDTPRVRRLCGWNQDTIERACDLTRDKFGLYLLTGGEGKDVRTNDRTAYGHVLREIEAWVSANPESHPLQLEDVAAKLLQQQIQREVRRSCLESRRQCNPGRTRYAWKSDRGTLYVWMPATLPGNRRRSWLAEHVPDADPERPGEAARVQAIVDDHLGLPRIVSLSDTAETGIDAGDRRATGEEGVEAAPINLAEFVAKEKADQVDQLRPSIKGLGREKVENLVRWIFRALSDESYQEKFLAEANGCSRSALTRFAGKDWRKHLPDLWRNTARVVSRHEHFIEAAIAAGVWERVQEVLRAVGDQEEEPR